MNAVPSEQAQGTLAGVADRVSPEARPSVDTRARLWPHLGILSVFWVYVAMSNILYANNMQANLSALHVEGFFARWEPRLLEHAMLYPILIGCVWLSLRMGWQPLWRRMPIQVLCGVCFAALGPLLLDLSEWLLDPAGRDESSAMHSAMQAAHSSMSWMGSSWFASSLTLLPQYGFALALITGFAFYQRLRDSELRSSALERALTSAHLAALRMQLSPHTLFNLLHMIRGHIGWDPVAAQSMVVQLGDLLRRLLTAGEREFSRLTDEMEFVRLYLELQQKRFADRLTVIIPARDSLAPVWVPSLILQPLVENAVVHGLAGHEGPVAVRVEAIFSDETLSLRVVNTVAPGQRVGRVGIGLNNVRERLAVQFGDRASFSAMPGFDKVWIAEIRMPLVREGPEIPIPKHRKG
jgi:hypothetical protein